MIYSKRKGNYMRVYADNAATTKMSRASIEAMNDAVENCWGNPSSLHCIGQHAAERLQKAREDIAEVLGCSPKEIYFTSGGSEADNQAIISAARIGERKGKKHIVSTAFEHHAVLHTLKKLEKEGFEIDLLDVKNNANITPEQVKNAIRDDTCLVTVMYANNELGSIQPIKELCKVAHDHGALFHTDAVQAVGHVAINVNDLGVDMLSASAHKFNGAKGVGFLYIRTGTTLPPYADGGAQEHGLRAGTENVAGIVSMAVALKKNVNDLDKNQRHILKLEGLLLQALNKSGIPYVRNGGDHTLPGVISLSFDGKDGEAILHRLDLMGVCISTGSACDSKNTEISHVLQAIRMPESLAKGTIRISLGKNNTADDIDTIVTALRKILL